MKKVSICYQHGCARRKIDTQLIYEYFKLNGWKVLKNSSKANLILISTCAFDNIHEDEAINFIKKIIERKNKNAELVIAGCLSSINEKRLSELGKFETISPRTLYKLDKIIDSKIKIDDLRDPFTLSGYENGEIVQDQGRNLIQKRSKLRILRIIYFKFFKWYSAFTKTYRKKTKSIPYNVWTEMYSKKTKLIRIAWGCLGNCSYCAIKFATGQLLSKPFKKIIEEFDEGFNRGYRKFCLVGADIGCYGLDIGTNFVELLKEIFKQFQQRDSYKIILFETNIRWILKYFDEFIGILKENPEKIESIVCPIQSGSDKILTLMRREHETSEVITSLQRIKKEAPNLKLITDIIVGFPGETEEDFKKTIELVKRIKFDTIQVFIYGDKVNTEASKLPNKVPEEIKTRRSSELLTVKYNNENSVDCCKRNSLSDDGIYG